MAEAKQNAWERWPTDEELANLLVNPETNMDNYGHACTPMNWPTGKHPQAICTCCDQDFGEGGWYAFAPSGRELIRILICGEHAGIPGMMEEEEAAEEALA